MLRASGEGTLLVDPGWVDEDAVAALGAIGADSDQLEAVVAGLEGPHRFGVNANNIPAAERADLVVAVRDLDFKRTGTAAERARIFLSQ